MFFKKDSEFFLLKSFNNFVQPIVTINQYMVKEMGKSLNGLLTIDENFKNYHEDEKKLIETKQNLLKDLCDELKSNFNRTIDSFFQNIIYFFFICTLFYLYCLKYRLLFRQLHLYYVLCKMSANFAHF